MWVRRTTEKVSLLTVGNVTYSGNPRIRVKFQYPNNWRLLINPTQREDAGIYMCQVSTHPPRVFTTNLTILGKKTTNIVNFLYKHMQRRLTLLLISLFLSIARAPSTHNRWARTRRWWSVLQVGKHRRSAVPNISQFLLERAWQHIQVRRTNYRETPQVEWD